MYELINESSFKEASTAYKISDIHIKEYDIENSVIYSDLEDVSNLYELMMPVLIQMADKIKSLVDDSLKPDFSFNYGNVVFRGTTVYTERGMLFTLRLIKAPVGLDDLNLPKSFVSAVSSRVLNSGGIVLITGLPGSGKTTVCVSSIIKRLERFGGLCYTVEDPPEINFQGNHGSGICMQTDSESLGGFAPSIKNLLRAYPSKGRGIMFVGEIRDSDTAEQVLLSALDGRLVFATMHSGYLIDAVKRFASLASKNIGRTVVLGMLSTSLKLCTNQSFKNGDFRQSYFTLNTTITSLITGDKLEQLSSEIERQALIHSKST